MLEYLKKYLSGDSEKVTVPEGYCPNCWGNQEYGGKFIAAVHNEKIDLNNIEQKRGWIEAYATKNLHGIQLKKTTCPVCKLS
jgi:hypothetical protein